MLWTNNLDLFFLTSRKLVTYWCYIKMTPWVKWFMLLNNAFVRPKKYSLFHHIISLFVAYNPIPLPHHVSIIPHFTAKYTIIILLVNYCGFLDFLVIWRGFYYVLLMMVFLSNSCSCTSSSYTISCTYSSIPIHNCLGIYVFNKIHGAHEVDMKLFPP